MNVQKSIQLTSEPLDYLLANGESIDFRLDEPQWNEIKVGSALEFWEDFSGWDTEPKVYARRVFVQVTDILRARTFSELIENQDLATFLHDDDEQEVLNNLRQWWKSENEEKFGVLGWKVRLIPA